MADADPPDSSALTAMKLGIERYKAKLDFWRAIIISGFVALAIAAIPPLFQLATAYVKHGEFEDQLRQDAQSKSLAQAADAEKFRSEYIKAFLDKALNQDIEIRLRLAEYFKRVAQGDEQKAWELYYNDLYGERGSVRTKIAEDEVALDKLQRANPTVSGVIEQNKLIQDLEWLRAEVGYVAPNKSAVRDPNSPISNATTATISLNFVPGRTDISQKIIDLFSKAGLGVSQQAAALADAIAESNLNPAAAGADNCFGLFQLCLLGYGAGYTPEQLKDPDTNIAIFTARAKENLPFVNATNLDDAVDTLVRLIVRPIDLNQARLRIGAIARKLVAAS